MTSQVMAILRKDFQKLADAFEAADAAGQPALGIGWRLTLARDEMMFAQERIQDAEWQQWAEDVGLVEK